MAEAIGVVLGVAGLFSACLDCLELVDSARNYEHESEVLVAKLDIQRVRLQIWGGLVGLTSEHSSDEPEALTRQEFGVKRCLEGIRRALTNSQDLISRYGLLQIEPLHDSTGCVALAPMLQTRAGRLRQGLITSLDSLLQGPRHVSIGRRMKWAIKDKQRFNVLVEDIKDFVDGLQAVVPAIQPRHKRLVERGIQSLHDDDVLELVAEATTDDYPDWSDTASVALQSQQGIQARSPQVIEWIRQTSDSGRIEAEPYSSPMDTKSEDASSGIGPSERAGGPASAPVSAAVARQCERAVVRARKAARDRMEEMIMTSKIEECLALIEPDTDLSDLSKTGTTMMHAAVRIGRCEVIKALLDAGADVDMRDEDGKTPLFASLDADLFSGSTTELLLESGADIESTDQLGRTALSYSVCQKWSKQKYWHRNSVYDLLAAKASMNTQDNQGYTPLMHAVIFSDENNCHASRDELLEHDPDVAIKTHAGTGLLDILATQDCPDWGCVVLCLISGSVVEPCELSSRNSLLDAVKNRDVAYAKFLIWTSMSLPEYKNISGDLAQLRCKDVREALFLAVSLEIVPLIRTFAIYHYSWPEDDNGWAMSLEDWCCPESEEDRMHPLVLNDETIMHAIIRTGSENLWNAIFLCDHGDEIMQEESFQKLIQYRSHVGDITPRQLAEKLGLRRWRDACESSRMRSQVESEVNRRRPSGP